MRSVLFASLFAFAPALSAADEAGENDDPRPSILFVIADDWGWPHAGVYGCGWVDTPHFDRVAEGGVLFTNAFTSNPKCSPCRASILTGRNSWQTGSAVCHFGVFPNTWPSYTHLLRDAGYKIGHTGKGWGPGDWKRGGWASDPVGPAYQQETADPPTRAMRRTDYAANFAAFLDERDEEAGDGTRPPFHFWLGPSEPHRTYEVGSGRRAGKDPGAVRLPAFYPDRREIREDLSDYALEVEHVDTHLGRALAELEERGELNNTLVVVTSDHGMPFPRVKGQIYEWGFHLPLAVMGPGVAPGRDGRTGRAVTDFINVRDFAPTFLEAAGVPVPESVTGRSFLDLLSSLEGGKSRMREDVMLVGKERHDIGRVDDRGYPVRAIRTPDWLYIHNFAPARWPAGSPLTGYRNVDDGATKSSLLARFDEYYALSFGKRPKEELYRAGDHENLTNLAADPAFADIKKTLKADLFRRLKAEDDPRLTGNPEVFDTYEYVGRKPHGWAAYQSHRKSPVAAPGE